MLNELLKNYAANFANKFKNGLIKKETLFIIERIKWLRSSGKRLRKLWNKVAKRQKLIYNVYHKTIIFNESDKIFLQNINLCTLRFKKKIDHN